MGLSLRSRRRGLRNSLCSDSPRPFPSVSLASSPPDKGGIGDCAFACINPLALRALPLYLLRKTPRNATGHGRGVLKAAFQTQRIEAGADVGTGGRDGNFYLHRSSLFSHAQASSGRRRSTSFTLPPMASTLRAASARALPSALSTK